MNNGTVAIICVALIATPAGYALERFYHQRQSASNDTVPAAVPRPEFSYQQDSVFAGEHMAVIAKAGWTRDDVKRYCFENTKISVAELKRINLKDGAVTPADEKEMVTLVHEPDDFLVVMAGGKAGVQSAYIPGWGGKNGSQAVTKEIHRP